FAWDPLSEAEPEDMGTKPAGSRVTWDVGSGETGVRLVKEGLTGLSELSLPRIVLNGPAFFLLSKNQHSVKCEIKTGKNGKGQINLADLNGRTVASVSFYENPGALRLIRVPLSRKLSGNNLLLVSITGAELVRILHQ
ncbi:MAG: hypothetical protein HQK83_14835, partial [Fibrobacteria bacterium]|nr:hypothetical protein [Fibrobacteria bacterium]